jgi:hypothetical protein
VSSKIFASFISKHNVYYRVGGVLALLFPLAGWEEGTEEDVLLGLEDDLLREGERDIPGDQEVGPGRKAFSTQHSAISPGVRSPERTADR